MIGLNRFLQAQATRVYFRVRMSFPLDDVTAVRSSASPRAAHAMCTRAGSVLTLLGVLALSAWGCSGGDPTGPDLLLSFAVERFDPRQGSLPSDTAEGGDGTITVRGGLQTPCLAHPSDLKGMAQKEGFTLFLQIRLELAVACTPGVQAFTYEALLGNLESGTYHLIVTNVFLNQSGYVTLEVDVSVR